jgi:hypothetical protein
MGKRSDFKRNKGDFYTTPQAPVQALLPYLKPQTRFCEPCAGDGRLVDHLTAAGHRCAAAWDTEPGRDDIAKQDARTRLIGNIDCFITNPPWTRALLHPIIENLSTQHPTWLLFDADWMHTRQADTYWQKCSLILSVGRVKWIEGSPFVGKDNACWYRFDPEHTAGPRFIGRTLDNLFHAARRITTLLHRTANDIDAALASKST